MMRGDHADRLRGLISFLQRTRAKAFNLRSPCNDAGRNADGARTISIVPKAGHYHSSLIYLKHLTDLLRKYRAVSLRRAWFFAGPLKGPISSMGGNRANLRGPG